MKTLATTLVSVLAVFLVLAMTTETPDYQTDPHAGLTVADAEFIGVARCKTCHRKEEVGAQFAQWEESAHSKAFATLATPEAKAIGAERGIDDPQTSDQCLKCHVTGHGAPAELLGRKYAVEDGVGCESCHGAGGDYYKKGTMQDITAGRTDGATLGLVTPTKETCETCHNDESPTFESFDFEARVADVAHPIPDAKKAEYN